MFLAVVAAERSGGRYEYLYLVADVAVVAAEGSRGRCRYFCLLLVTDSQHFPTVSDSQMMYRLHLEVEGVPSTHSVDLAGYFPQVDGILHHHLLIPGIPTSARR